MVDNTAKTTTSWGATLPPYIHARMEDLTLKPSVRKLASLSGVPAMTLHRNFSGERAMTFETAKKIAAALQVTLDELGRNSLSFGS